MTVNEILEQHLVLRQWAEPLENTKSCSTCSIAQLAFGARLKNEDKIALSSPG